MSFDWWTYHKMLFQQLLQAIALFLVVNTLCSTPWHQNRCR